MCIYQYMVSYAPQTVIDRAQTLNSWKIFDNCLTQINSIAFPHTIWNVSKPAQK